MDCRHHELEFAVGGHVILKVSSMMGVSRFGKKGKLNHRYIGSFEILERVEAMAYRLMLHLDVLMVHFVFHVSIFKRYLPDPSHVILTQDI